jgi:hypothetical protein
MVPSEIAEDKILRKDSLRGSSSNARFNRRFTIIPSFLLVRKKHFAGIRHTKRFHWIRPRPVSQQSISLERFEKI